MIQLRRNLESNVLACRAFEYSRVLQFCFRYQLCVLCFQAGLLAGVDSPTLHPTVIAVKEGALRLAGHPATNRAEPLDVIYLRILASECNQKKNFFN